MLYMNETAQLNIRVSEQLLDDIDKISNELGITRSEWIKVKLAELVRHNKTPERLKTKNEIVNEKIKAIITKR